MRAELLVNIIGEAFPEQRTPGAVKRVSQETVSSIGGSAA